MENNPPNIDKRESLNELKLDEFPGSDYQSWKTEADRLLEGESFEEKLTSETYENIRLKPIYWRDDVTGLDYKSSYPGQPPFIRSTAPLGYVIKSWEIAQKLPYSMPDQFNEGLRDILNRGQTAISLKLDKASKRCLDPDRADIGEVGRNGTSIAAINDFGILFKNLELAAKTIHLKTGASALPFASLLYGYFKKAGIRPETVKCSFKPDPISELATQGELPFSLDIAYDEMAFLARWAIKSGLDIKTMAVDSSIYHNSGSSAVEELAFAIATGLEYLREMSKRKLPLNEVAGQMTFIFSVGSRFFTEIAKLRAARMLWASVVDACGGDERAQKMTIHAKTSYYNKTGLDTHVNMLRVTTEAFSAVAGGCDSLHVGYYDEAIKQPDELSRRFAGNIQLILREECHLDKVIDPAGGSWYVESLTNQLAHQAWELFQEIEAEGGIIESLKKGSIQQRIDTQATRRLDNIARREDIFVGATMYMNGSEQAPEKQIPDYKRIHDERKKDLGVFRESIDKDKKSRAMEDLFQASDSSSETLMDKAIEAAAAGATLGEIARAIRRDDGKQIKIYPLKIQRGAEMFEVLRKTVESSKEKYGNTPKVHLLCFGKLSEYKSREEFATGFFESAGFETISHRVDEIDAAAQAVIDSQGMLAVICSSDANYPQKVSNIAKGLKNKKPEMIIIMAGKPGDKLDDYKKAGIDYFIYRGVNVYETLVRLSRKIGILS